MLCFDWLICWLVACLFESLIHSFVDWMIVWLVDWFIHSFVDWMIVWLIDSFIHLLIEWFNDWLIDWFIDSFICWFIACVIDWINSHAMKCALLSLWPHKWLMIVTADWRQFLFFFLRIYSKFTKIHICFIKESNAIIMLDTTLCITNCMMSWLRRLHSLPQLRTSMITT